MNTGETRLYARWQRAGATPAGDASSMHQARAGRWRVVFPGWRNHQEGPDFIHALIERDGRIVKGDVELHHRARDWAHHGHHRDPRYNHVILQVVEGEERLTCETAQGRAIPTVKLFVPPGGSVPSRMSSESPRCLAERGGWIRFRRKVARMRRWVEKEGEEQGLYVGLCDALGYGKCRRPMKALARRVPLREIQRLCIVQEQGVPERIREEADRLTWNVPCTRPANRPARRLEELIRILSKERGGMAAPMWAFVKTGRPVQAMARSWGLSRDLSRRLIINVVLPWLVVMARRHNIPWWEDVATKWYREYTPESSNALTRAVTAYVGGKRTHEKIFPRTALYQQGLQWMALSPERWMAVSPS